MTIQEIPTPAETPETLDPVVAAVESLEPSKSIADHASQFSPDRKETVEIPKTPANTGQFANRPPDAKHRASTQRATPEDVAQINTLTKELRELEGKLADKDPDAKASPRIKTLKRQIAALKALDAPVTTKTEPEPVKKPEPVAATFDEKEPVLEDFSDTTKYPDPYLAHARALAAYDRKKEAADAERTAAETAKLEAQKATIRAYHERATAFKATTPDFDPVVKAFYETDHPEALTQAIIRDDKGPELVYHLAQHQDWLDEMVLLTHQRAPTDAFVAAVQRRLGKELASRTQVASTGSTVPPSRPYSPPRPPNPVRTGPIKTTDEPPEKASSIAEHAKYFSPKAR